MYLFVWRGHDNKVSIRTQWLTHKLFSIYNLLVLAEPQYERSVIRSHWQSSPSALSAEHTLLVARLSPSIIEAFSLSFSLHWESGQITTRNERAVRVLYALLLSRRVLLISHVDSLIWWLWNKMMKGAVCQSCMEKYNQVVFLYLTHRDIQHGLHTCSSSVKINSSVRQFGVLSAVMSSTVRRYERHFSSFATVCDFAWVRHNGKDIALRC